MHFWLFVMHFHKMYLIAGENSGTKSDSNDGGKKGNK